MTGLTPRIDGSSAASAPRRSRAAWFAVALLGLALFVVIIRAAWLCDDAYITIRTVDNFVHGYGLRWNIDERVQAYTHPLWMWALVPGYLLSGSARVTLISTGLVAAFAALVLLVRAGRPRPAVTAAVLLGLAGSKSFVEYSTSGLEEALLFCLLAAIVPLLIVSSSPRRPPVLALFLTTLLFLTRMDAVIIVMPLLLWRLAGEWRQRPRWVLAAAVSPAVLWLAFSTFYYGAPFPNTAYAKLGHGIPRWELVRQGFRYLSDFGSMDPAGTAFAIGGLVLAALRRRWTLAAGLVLWAAYVVWIGGDFMSGRMLAPLVWTGAIVLVTTGPSLNFGLAMAAGAAVLALGFLSPSPAFWGRPQRAGSGRSDHAVTDERQFYYPNTGLLIHRFTETAFEHPWPRRVLDARDEGRFVMPFKWVGFAGYFGGPKVHLVDEYGLTDALIARLPAESDWNPGHFHRLVPDGYVETLAAGDGVNRIQDPATRRYYERLAKVIRGPLFAPGRFREIAWLNLGSGRSGPR